MYNLIYCYISCRIISDVNVSKSSMTIKGPLKCYQEPSESLSKTPQIHSDRLSNPLKIL